MKTCLNCMITIKDDSIEKCPVCGASNFRKGRPKNGVKYYEDIQREKFESTTESSSSEIGNNDSDIDIKDTKELDNVYTVDNKNYNDMIIADDINIVKWIVTFVVCSIPIIGIIYAVIGIAKARNRSYKSYLIAMLIFKIIGVIVGIVLNSIITPIITDYMYTLY